MAGSVNKKQLVDRVAARTGFAVNKTHVVISAMIDEIIESVCNDEEVTLPGFMKFGKSTVAARQGRNPQTGEPVDIPPTVRVKAKAGLPFRNKVKETHKA